jgi:hypothetical protein
VAGTSVLVHNDPAPAPGEGKSITVWSSQDDRFRIDVETRRGVVDIHLQEKIRGVPSSKAPKYHYNAETNEFEGMSSATRKLLDKKYSGWRKGAEKAKTRFLGGGGEAC